MCRPGELTICNLSAGHDVLPRQYALGNYLVGTMHPQLDPERAVKQAEHYLCLDKQPPEMNVHN